MLKNLLNNVIFSRRKEIPFIIFFSFLITFGATRIVVYSIHNNLVPDLLFFVKTVYIRGYHIHHFNFGIVLLVIAGFFSLVDAARNHVRKTAILYGIGLALITDEFGFLVTLNANASAYWSRQSYDAVITIGFLLLNIAYFGRFWKVMGNKIKRLFI